MVGPSLSVRDAHRVAHPRWVGVFAVATGICVVVTAEQLPIGLLTQIGDTFAARPAVLGLLVTVPGLLAAGSAPLVPVLARRLDRRTLLVALIGLLAVSNVLAAVAPTLPVLMAARVLTGVTIGGFWAVAATLADRLVPPDAVPRATGVIFGGIAAGNVLGTPAGTLLGGFLDWRWAFAALVGCALLVGAGLVAGLPRLPATRLVGLRTLGAQLRTPAVRAALLGTLLVVVGQFAAFTFVSPVLQRSGYPAGEVGFVLVAYGIAGMAGNAVAARIAALSVRRAALGVAVAVAVTVTLVALLTTGPVLGTAAVVLWGFAYGGVSVSVLSAVRDAAVQGAEPGTAAGALGVSVFNLSIAAGALAGGALVDAAGLTPTLVAAAVVVALGAVPLARLRAN